MAKDVSRDHVTLRYRPDDDGTGELQVVAEADGWAGVASAWFDTVGLLEFAEGLTAFPLVRPFPHVAGGYGGRANFEATVSLEVIPIGPHGQIGLLAYLATHVWPDDTISTKREVRLVLLTTYERLGRFARDLRDLLHGRSAQAMIGAEELIR